MPDVTYPKNPNSDTVFVEDGGQKTRAVKTVQLDGTVDYPSNPNSDSCYVTVDGKKQRALMVADVSSAGTVEYPESPNSTKGYVTVDGKKHRVNLTATLVGGGSVPNYYSKKVIENGKLAQDELQDTLSTSPATDVDDHGLSYWAAGRSTSISVDCSSLTQVTGYYAFYKAFDEAPIYSFDFSNIVSVGESSFEYGFWECGALDVDLVFDSLTTIGSSGFSYAFAGSSGFTSISFPALTTAGRAAFESAFTYVAGSISMPALSTVGSNCFAGAFVGCEFSSISFPALTQCDDFCFAGAFSYNTNIESITFGNTAEITFGSDPFADMFEGCDQNIDVYAPAANQAEIEGMSGYPEFSSQATVTWHWRS